MDTPCSLHSHPVHRRMKGVSFLCPFILFISVFSFPAVLSAQTDSILDILQKRGEIYFSFQRPRNISLRELSAEVSVTAVRNDTVFAFANNKQWQTFKAFSIPYKLLNPLPEFRNSKVRLKSGQDWAYYPGYGSYVQLMQQFAAQYPELCVLYDIGTTVYGHRLLVLKISDNAAKEEAEPAVFYTSGIHGNETAGFVLLLRLADSLLSSYSSNPQIRELVDSLEIFINPVANPDGTYYGGDSTVWQATRYNANHVDLNRNFPDPVYGLHPDDEEWQPETKAMMGFMKAHPTDLSVNFHTGAEVVNYPWDSWPRDHADNGWYVALSREYADTAIAWGTNYFTSPMFDRGIIRGYDWYPISGGRQDYVNYYLHSREVTIELSNTFIPDPSFLPELWNYNKRSLIHYMENVLYGIHGKITDSQTNKPVRAMISIPGHDKDSSTIYSRNDYGDYYRLLQPGIYTFEFSAPGYQTKSIPGVTVGKDSCTRLDVSLAPVRSGVNPEKKEPLFTIWPNPFYNNIHTTTAKDTNIRSLILYTTSGIKLKQLKHGGIIYTGDLPPGIYILEVTDESGKYSFRMIKNK